MDVTWQIDVRKATARIPGDLQPELHRIAQATRRRAAEVYRFRGKSIARQGDGQRGIRFVWERVTRRGTHVFRVNRRHPALRAVSGVGGETAVAVERALRVVEENLPIEAIVMESREHPDSDRGAPYAGDTGELLVLLKAAHSAMIGEGTDAKTALAALAAIEPFEFFPELVQVLGEELGT
jgi:hypothetical protein